MFTGPAGFDYLRWRCNCVAFHLPRLHRFGVLLQGIAPLGLIAGACGFFLPILLLSMGAPHLPAGLTSLLAASELPAGLFVAMIVLGSPIGAVEWLGVAIILFGICVSQLRLFPRKAPR